MEIVAQEGDITQMKADAVVNPANSLGEMGGGVAGVLRREGGPEIEEEAKSKAPIPVGEAVQTVAGKLPYRYVIHAPTMEKPSQRTTVENVRKATLAALLCSDSFGVKILAMPGMGTGIGGVSPEAAAEAMVETLRNYESASVRKVILVDKNPEMVRAFHAALLAERA
jgi:O-acetyl-ADP-ribose deacetylase